jgi:hypothetical protein
MNRPMKRKARTLLSEFSSRVGSETLKIRFYRERGAYVCERELVERDGTSFTMVVPFRKRETAQKLLVSDPYYAQVKLKAKRALSALEHVGASNEKPERTNP